MKTPLRQQRMKQPQQTLRHLTVFSPFVKNSWLSALVYRAVSAPELILADDLVIVCVQLFQDTVNPESNGNSQSTLHTNPAIITVNAGTLQRDTVIVEHDLEFFDFACVLLDS